MYDFDVKILRILYLLKTKFARKLNYVQLEYINYTNRNNLNILFFDGQRMYSISYFQ